MDEKKLADRIGDVTTDKAEAERISKTVAVLESVVQERFDEFAGKLPEHIGPTVKTTVAEAVQAALKAEREAKLPEADPKRRILDCTGDFLRHLKNGTIPRDGMRELLEKYPEHFMASDRPINLDLLQEECRKNPWWGDVRSTMASSSSGMSYVLPTPMSNEVQGYATEAMPVMAVLRQLPVISGISGSVPVGTSDGSTTYITSEASAPTDSTIVPGTFAYTLMKFACGVPVTNTLWNLSVPAFQSWVIRDAGYSFGIKQHAQFAVGTNSTQWMGLEYASLSAVANPGGTPADGITALFLALPQMHRAVGVFCCNETTLGYIWMMKDGSGKREIPFDVEKMTLYGRPIYTNSAFTDGYLFFIDPTRYIRSSSDYKAATIGFGNGFTMTSQDSTYLYIGEMLDGGVSDTNAGRYAIVTP
jgi:HK97 family phage major capsid protein